MIAVKRDHWRLIETRDRRIPRPVGLGSALPVLLRFRLLTDPGGLDASDPGFDDGLAPQSEFVDVNTWCTVTICYHGTE